MNNVEKISLTQIKTGQGKQTVEDFVVIEMPLTIVLNNKELVTMLCSPENLEYLAAGFLFSEGILQGKDEIHKVIVDEKIGVVRVETNREIPELDAQIFKRTITSGCGRGASFYNLSDLKGLSRIDIKTEISSKAVLKLAKDFQQRSQVYRETHGVHSAALIDNQSILVFCEDIGRHNAVDKVLGKCIVNDIPMNDRSIITTGRISSEIVIKVAKRNIPVLISKSVPTSIAIRMADTLGVTLIGFVRGDRMKIYTHNWRVKVDV